MAKILNIQQIIGEKGVAAFHLYCANHNPPILWREEMKHDFGVDGEIEIVRKNDVGQHVVTGEIMKVQIKSTETGSYISEESDDSFNFTGKQEDLEYWLNHKLDVILVVFFVKTNALYAKKIEQIDSERTKKQISITFNRKATELKIGESNFLSKYSQYFKGRVNWDNGELLFTNIFWFNKLPKYIYAYKSEVTDKQEIWDSEIKPTPDFVLKSSTFYTFLKLDQFPEFCKKFIKQDPPEIILFKKFLKEKITKNYAIELLNKYFRAHCFKKGIGYIKDYNRYFFKKFNNEPLSRLEQKTFVKEVYRINNYKPKLARRDLVERETVTRYCYHDSVDFYRHFAFESHFFQDDSNLYVSITPKYFFTSDGKNVLEDKKRITRYTNYMTSREFNQQVLNHIYFIYQYLSDNKDHICLADFENCTISIARMISIQAPFSIDYTETIQKQNESSVDDEIQLMQSFINFESNGDPTA